MPPPPRAPRTSTSGQRPSTSTPMSERQQLALLMQMTSTNEAGKDLAYNGPNRLLLYRSF